ncbi:PBP1A family penicillin-binding protein [Candidatus Dependentiae bacterium]|nr:PBP1A family penicillin-binding protein [Candidatus Dependentiae bacterium]
MIKHFFSFLFLASVIVVSCALGALFYVTTQPAIDFSVLEHYNPGKPTILLDDTGAEWTRFQLDRREVVSIKKIPDHVIKAFLAAEDWEFFKHAGISWRGIARSIIVNLYHRRRAQGASTITQQLVKLLFFNSEKSFKRKIQEQFIALSVEQQFTKEQILETYLNHVYFGAGIYGVEAASQRFWSKNVRDLSIDQAALLAGIVQAPNRYCPLYNPEQAVQRRTTILNSMAKLKFITEQQYQEARQSSLNITAACDPHSQGPHFKESIRLMLEELIGKQKLYSGGLKIQTTVNVPMQIAAEAAFTTTVKRLRTEITPDIDGALLSIDSQTGAVKALVGGYDFQQSQFNRALKAKRQIGSTFKPVIYAAALQSGKKFTDLEVDEPVIITDNGKAWEPQNFNHEFEGPVTLARALSRSNNIVSIKTLLHAGAESVVSLAKKCGFKGPLYPYPSLALGCVDSTLPEVVSMMNVIAQNGLYVEPYCISWIKDEWGTKIWKHNPVRKRVIRPTVTGQVAKVLTISMERSRTRNPQDWLQCDSLGKTGTTNDARTCWFTGATPSLTTAVYIGCDDNKSLGKAVYAVQTAFPIWKEFNKKAGSLRTHFSYDPSLKEVIVHDQTGEPVSADDPHAIALLVDPATA